MAGLIEQIHAQKAGRDGGDQAQRGDHGQPHHGIRLASQAVAVQILIHFLDRLADIPINPVGVEMAGQHPEQILGLRLIGNLVEPVAVGEAQESFEDPADFPLERFD